VRIILTASTLVVLIIMSSINVQAATITVPAGGNLQTAIDEAQPGDVIMVEAGAFFRGPIELPAKDGDAEIVIQSSRVADLPPGRVNLSHSSLMPKIICTEFDQAIRTLPGAHHYTFVGIEVLPDPQAVVNDVIRFFDLVRFGGSRHEQQTLESVPHHLKIDRSIIRGLPEVSFQRGLSLNSSDSEVTRSYFAEIHGHGMDSQAIASWNTPGRNKVVDNYLEAGSENILWGGADPFSADFIPTGDQILRNHCFKPLTWRGAGWVVKNLLEIKNGRNLLIDGNVFENNWTDGQTGIPILFTVRNQEGTAPYSIIENVTFTNNIVKNAEGALNLLGTDNEKPSARCRGLFIRNNVFDKIAGHFLTMNGYHDVAVERNTHTQSSNTTTLYGEPSEGFIYRDNVTSERAYGFWGEGGLIGTAALERWTPGYVFTGNVVAHPPLPSDQNWYSPMPDGNEYPPSVEIGADYRTSYVGKGADIDQLNAAQSGTVTTPIPTPTPTPTPVPSPTPTPSPSEPAIGSLKRDVPWETTEGKQDQQAATMRAQGWYFHKNQLGKKATFIYTGVKLP
jgi:hypothetical protein